MYQKNKDPNEFIGFIDYSIRINNHKSRTNKRERTANTSETMNDESEE